MAAEAYLPQRRISCAKGIPMEKITTFVIPSSFKG